MKMAPGAGIERRIPIPRPDVTADCGLGVLDLDDPSSSITTRGIMQVPRVALNSCGLARLLGLAAYGGVGMEVVSGIKTPRLLNCNSMGQSLGLRRGRNHL
jgi:hypothetical protein